MCKVNVTDFRSNISHYIELSASEDIHVTKNGEVVAVLTNPDKDYYQKLINLCGCLKDYIEHHFYISFLLLNQDKISL